jgi:hypothetical protein
MLLRTLSGLEVDDFRLPEPKPHLFRRSAWPFVGSAVIVTVYPNPSFAIPSRSTYWNGLVLPRDSVVCGCELLLLVESFRAKSDLDRRFGSRRVRPDSFKAGRLAADGPRVINRPIIGRSTATQETILKGVLVSIARPKTRSLTYH